MLKSALKFVLPVAVAGAGGATAFGSSPNNHQHLSSSFPKTISSSRIRQLETTSSLSVAPSISSSQVAPSVTFTTEGSAVTSQPSVTAVEQFPDRAVSSPEGERSEVTVETRESPTPDQVSDSPEPDLPVKLQDISETLDDREEEPESDSHVQGEVASVELQGPEAQTGPQERDNSLGTRSQEESDMSSGQLALTRRDSEPEAFVVSQPQGQSELAEAHTDHQQLEGLPKAEEQTGNCKVVNNQQKVINKLLKEKAQTYIAFSCHNPNTSSADPVLTRWHGFFPVTLFSGGEEAFPENRQFNIEVKEGDNEEEEDMEIGIYETTFTSAEFSISSSSMVGRWSEVTVGSEDDGSDEDLPDESDTDVYKVKLVGAPNSIEYVYLTHS